MNQTEMLMRRRNVGAHIDADPVSIQFSRKGPSTRTAAGGLVPGVTSTLAPQRAAIIQGKRRYDPGLVNAEPGEIPDTQYLLLGRYNLDVQVDDTFFWRGDRYKVVGIHPTRTESVLAAIDYDGPVNHG